MHEMRKKLLELQEWFMKQNQIRLESGDKYKALRDLPASKDRRVKMLQFLAELDNASDEEMPHIFNEYLEFAPKFMDEVEKVHAMTDRMKKEFMKDMKQHG
jgi:hypothetical protein